MKIELSVDQAELDRERDVSVSWKTEGATTVLLSDVGRVEAEGSISVRVSETRTFVLTAFDAAHGRVVCDQQTVTVRERAPRGIVVPWWGDGREPPEGWVICDGENGTPDLRGRFVLGAGGAAPPNRTGGGEPHAHTLDAVAIEGHATDGQGGHGHAAERPDTRRFDRKGDGPRSIQLENEGAAEAAWVDAGAHRHALAITLPPGNSSDQPDPHPPWHALHYLMKR